MNKNINSNRITYVPKDEDEITVVMLNPKKKKIIYDYTSSSSEEEEEEEYVIPMTFLEAAKYLLKGVRSMHYREMMKIIKERNLVNTKGLTPQNTLYGILYKESNKIHSNIMSYGNGKFGLI